MALAVMETLADYGATSFLGVQTLTTGAVRAWSVFGSTADAAPPSPCVRCTSRPSSTRSCAASGSRGVSDSGVGAVGFVAPVVAVWTAGGVVSTPPVVGVVRHAVPAANNTTSGSLSQRILRRVSGRGLWVKPGAFSARARC